jgi:hypothetical protein
MPTTAISTATATTARGVRRRTVVDLRPLRPAGAALLGAALVLPLLPGSPGVPCPLHTLTGVPCPLCGTTRSVTATVRGRVGEALALNPAGVALVVAAVALLFLPRASTTSVPAWAPPAAVAVLWAYQLGRAVLF